jgi:uncharacterized protein with ParB-like and HNH nuclease domain/predicted transport protein
MKAKECTLLDLFSGPTHYRIPIYQRTYSWTTKQCTQLWKDIVHVGTHPEISGHFLGSVVYIEHEGPQPKSAIREMLLIDGQQRLATLSLLLAALARSIADSTPPITNPTPDEINDYYLFNTHAHGDRRYKLLLTQSDKPTLASLLEGTDLVEPISHRLVDNFGFFKEQIAKSGVALPDIYGGISKLRIVDVALDSRYDNPQLIFESLNSTGLALSQADLIRNYVLMIRPKDEQEELYSRHWYPMEQSFGQAGYAAFFDRFMRDYLTVKMGRIPNIYQVYEEFKLYAQSSKSDTIPAIVADIHRYSRYFVNMALEREPDKELRAAFNDINTLRVEVAYPLLLELYDDYAEARLSQSDFLHMVRYIESYVFRRAVVGIPTASLNKTFATFSRDLDKTHYLESFMAALLLKDSYRRFPSNAEFVRELQAKDVYNFRSRNYCLWKLENHDRKEAVRVSDYTVEHILPQNENLSEAWRQDLGVDWREVQARYLHTLGNLTLTGNNGPLGDHPFVQKRDMNDGFADSPIRLSRGLVHLEHWNEAAIQARARELADLAVNVWPYPLLDQAVLASYRRTKIANAYTLADHPHLTGPVGDLFEQFRRRVLNLDASVAEEVLKYYIAYKTTTNFVDVVPQKRRLLLMLNMAFDLVVDPNGLCRDVSGLGRWGNGDVEVRLSSPDQLDAVMLLVQQSFDLHMEYGEA